MDQHAKKSSPGGDKKISDDIINPFRDVKVVTGSTTPKLLCWISFYSKEEQSI